MKIPSIENEYKKLERSPSSLSKFLRWSLMIFIIKDFRIIVFIFIVISTELRTTSFIESMGVACSDSFSYNRVQELSIPVFLLVCSQDWTCNLQMIVSLEA